MEATNIYVLKLQENKYYIGKSKNDVIARYQQHVNGQGSTWTKKYKPISLLEKRENVSPLMEDLVTKEYMIKYGIQNVRGGSYVELELSEFHISALQMEIWNATDCCSQCGRDNHWVNDCYARTDVNGKAIEYEDNEDDEGDEDDDNEDDDE